MLFIFRLICGVLIAGCVILALGYIIIGIGAADKKKNGAKYSEETKKLSEEFSQKQKIEQGKYERFVKEYNDEISEFNNKYFSYLKDGEFDICVGINDNELNVFKTILPKKYEIGKKSFGWDDTYSAQIIEKESVAGSVVKIKSWKLESIVFFSSEGNLQYTERISGGGVDVKGAVIGGIIGGEAGAIVGGRQSVTSSTMKHDDRYTLLKLINEEVHLPFEIYEFLTKLIPEKEYKYLQAKQAKTIIKEQQTEESVDEIEKIKKFKDLLDSGIITQEEFDAKKKELLGL